ncbi:diguanylate cyclase [Chitinimonas lacunae]|uniref:diguanylate cyclase n=1 Tax=Chitinimonas lacunae TaxID=1963018 RepID=A0ABV8MQ57_9NEIS
MLAWSSLAADEAEREVTRDPRGAVERAQIKVQQAAQRGNRTDELAGLLMMARGYGLLEEHRLLGDTLARALALAESLNDKATLGRLWVIKAGMLNAAAQYKEAAALYERAIVLAQQRQDNELLADAYSGKGYLLEGQRRSNEALAMFFAAHALYVKLGNEPDIGSILAAIADTYSNLQDRQRALEYYQRARTKLSTVGDALSLSVLDFNMGVTYHELNQLDQAERHYRSALAGSQQLRDNVGIAYARYRLGRVAAERGQLDYALSELKAAQQEFERSGSLPMRFVVQLLRAKVLAQQGQPIALAVLDDTRTLLGQLDTPDRWQEFHLTAAEVYAHFNRFEDAYRQMQRLREVDQAEIERSDRKLTEEMKLKFDTQLKEAENALLRSQQQLQQAELNESNARRFALGAALLATLVILGVVGFLLWRQVVLKRRFADLALHDELTGAPNRRHILAYAKRQLTLSRELGTPFSVAVLDLDYFKRINDSYGHDTGDRVLLAFAHACQGQLRSGDRLGRFGGEEWLLVMPGTDTGPCRNVFERLRGAFQAEVIEGLPADYTVSFSMGVAERTERDQSLDTLLKRADEALYRAKSQGRDRIEVEG